MKLKYTWQEILFIALCSLVMFGHDSSAETLQGLCVGVGDGDTITVLDTLDQKHTIRLFAIDAPEVSCHSNKPSPRDSLCKEKGQPFGQASKKHLAAMVYGKQVLIELQPGFTYGREIGTVLIGDINVNLEQIRKGYAWFHRKYAKHGLSPGDFKEIEEAELLAREYGFGLWSEKNAVEPWNYRHNGG